MCFSVCVCALSKVWKWANLGGRDKLHFHLKYLYLLEPVTTIQGKTIILKFAPLPLQSKDLQNFASTDRQK